MKWFRVGGVVFAAVAGSMAAFSVATAQPSAFTGSWVGTLSSRNHSPVPLTLVINNGVGVKLAGAVNLISPCLKDADLEITTDGANIVLAGSDDEEDTVTLKGSLDETGTQLTITYIINGSASGRCETDDGSGILKKK
jgi:hypothetical protein